MALDVSGPACEKVDLPRVYVEPVMLYVYVKVRRLRIQPAALRLRSGERPCTKDCHVSSGQAYHLSPRWYSNTVGLKDEWHPRLENRLHPVIMGYWMPGGGIKGFSKTGTISAMSSRRRQGVHGIERI